MPQANCIDWRFTLISAARTLAVLIGSVH